MAAPPTRVGGGGTRCCARLLGTTIENAFDLRRGRSGIAAAAAVAEDTGSDKLAMRLLRSSGERLGPATAPRILDEVDHMLTETLEGQAMELGWIRDNDCTVGVDDYLRLVLKKTA